MGGYALAGVSIPAFRVQRSVPVLLPRREGVAGAGAVSEGAGSSRPDPGMTSAHGSALLVVERGAGALL